MNFDAPGTAGRRDRLIVAAALAAIAALAWAYLVYDARSLHCMSLMAAAGRQPHPWTVVDASLMFIMWAVMMVAMMVPSVAPMVLLFASVSRKRQEQQRPYVPTGIFLCGYLVAWTAFSALATAAQWALQASALLSATMALRSPMWSGGLLLAAGVFQFTPLKRACLIHCRTPLTFLMTEWREGAWGALLMGLRHGGYCVGCCWFLMGLLFVAGAMNLLWVAAISAMVLAEKIAPNRLRVSWVGGILSVAWGACLAAGWVR